MTDPTDDLPTETLDELERLEREAFRAPWTYDQWEVECSACEGGTNEPESGCTNPDCDGADAPIIAVESPEEYPDGQVVAQISVPGLLCLADKNGALIAKMRNALPALLHSAKALAAERAKVAELTSAFDIDEKAIEELETERDSLRATLAKVEAERDNIKELAAAMQINEPEALAFRARDGAERLAKVDTFFADHGESLENAACAGLLRATSENLVDRAQWEAAYRAFQRLHNEHRPPGDGGWFSDGMPKETKET
jgi:hypothetical protein